MTKKPILRIVLYLVASILVVKVTIVLVVLVFKGYQQVKEPSVNSIVAGLNSLNEAERRAALEKIKYPIWNKPEIIQAVSNMALTEKNPYLQSEAINRSLQGYSRYQNMSREQLASTKDKPALTAEKINLIASLSLNEKVEDNLGFNNNPVYSALHVFLQNTVNAQQDPMRYVTHFTRLLEAVLEQKNTDSRNNKANRILYTLSAYGRYVVLPDETMYLLLDVYQGKYGAPGGAAEIVIKAFNYQASKQVFSSDLTATLEAAMLNDKNNRIRLITMTALEQQARLTGVLSPAFEKAINDEDSWNANVASNTITRFKQEQGAKTGKGAQALADLAFDKTQPPSVRASALRQGVVFKDGKTIITPRIIKAVETLRDAPEPELRAASTYYIRYLWKHDAYRQRQDVLLRWLESAMRDKNAMVRREAVFVLEYFPDTDERNEFVITALNDSDVEVVKDALRIVSVKKLNTPAIHEQLGRLQEHADPAVQMIAKEYYERLELQNMNIFQAIFRAAADPEGRVGLLYFVAVLAATIIGAGFAIYYAYTFIRYVIDKRMRSIASVLALLVWIVASYALTVYFIIGLFAMGHNTPAPIDQQMHITQAFTKYLALYGVLGIVMAFLVRVPKTKHKPVHRTR